jgi:hypothetical protein
MGKRHSIIPALRSITRNNLALGKQWNNSSPGESRPQRYPLALVRGYRKTGGRSMKNALTTSTAIQGAIQTTAIDSTTPAKKSNSLRKAINDKCRHCIYDPHSGSGTWRQQVSACTSKQCPLYPVRPMPADNTTGQLIALTDPENGHFDTTAVSCEVLP